nr:MAG: hypothetical protein DIU78_25730 [Pseudomonadota bacterium]
MCSGSGDCISRHCADGRCAAPTCDDGIRNQGESDVDCGGSSPCDRCGSGKACMTHGDCASGACVEGKCVAGSCEDGVLNGDETDIDCGGSCPKCVAGFACRTGGDCQSEICLTNTCQLPTCSDGLANGNETDVDCGGACALKCGSNQACRSDADCASKVCEAGRCQSPSCEDGVANGGETGRDCGGVSDCGPCPAGEACATNADCEPGLFCHPKNSVCATEGCGDGLKNGSETDVDCGGSCSTKCDTGQGCAVAADCVSNNCTGPQGSRTCAAPTCDDGIRNQGETDVDCGGPNCQDCADGRNCSAGSDCTSGVCGGGICQVPTCGDGTKNQDETDRDCGGSCDDPCADGQGCVLPRDCDSTVCSTTCQPNQFAALYRNFDDNTGDSEIKAEVGIANFSGESIDSGDIKLRYYFTSESQGADEVACFAVAGGPAGADCNDRVIAFGTENGSSYVELAFKAGAFTVPHQGTTGTFQLQIHKADWKNLDETNDHSFDPARTTVGENRNITVYRRSGSNWTRVYGLPPPPPAPTP